MSTAHLNSTLASTALFCLLTALPLASPRVSAQGTATAPTTETPATKTAQRATSDRAAETSVKPGINDRFLDPKLNVDEWLGRFEIESREVYSARDKVLSEMGIRPGSAIADIGAGTGFYSRLFAEAVGEDGEVFAVDLSQPFIDHITVKARESKIHNLTPVRCTERSTELPPGCVETVFICDTYHHFEYPQSTLQSIHQALKPGGKLVVIDFDRIKGKSREFILGHVRAGKNVFRKEIESAGFKLEREVEIDGFEENYMLIFIRS